MTVSPAPQIGIDSHSLRCKSTVSMMGPLKHNESATRSKEEVTP